jgi:hypothetical protein
MNPRELLADVRTLGRYAGRLPSFLRSPLTAEEAVRRLEVQLGRREEGFLRMLAAAAYRGRRSPYRALLDDAGVELGDVERMVRDDGLEAALARLYDAGVHVTLDEFKGRRPIVRSGREIPAGPGRFDNPLAPGHLRLLSGGSSGSARRVSVDLDLLEYESAYHSLFLDSFELRARPFALWRVIPPSASGINNSLRQLKLGLPVARWFNPHKAGHDSESLTFGQFTRLTLLLARAAGTPMARPEHCPPEDAVRVVRWLAECRARGTPAVLDTQAALGVRVCRAALDSGTDISGTFFRFGGEPYTEVREGIVREAGCFATCHYTMAELGRIAIACGAPAHRDDGHFVSDKLAVLQRERDVGGNGRKVGALVYTTLLPSAPKFLINAESDDYGMLEERSCGCPLGAVGLGTHLHTIRSYEKLTAEGNHFLGSDLLELIDEVLPRRFGGGPTDYQLAEQEVDGLPKVTVIVRPSVGPVDEVAVIRTVLDHLRSQPRNRLMAEVWREGGTLRVARREPYVTTPSSKILSLYSVPAD